MLGDLLVWVLHVCVYRNVKQEHHKQITLEKLILSQVCIEGGKAKEVAINVCSMNLVGLAAAYLVSNKSC